MASAFRPGPPPGWIDFGDQGLGYYRRPSIACNANGELEVFVLLQSRLLGRRRQTQPGSDSWNDWQYWDRPSSVLYFLSQRAVRNADGRLEVFAIGYDSYNLWHRWELYAGSDQWSDWANLGGVILDLRPILNPDGVLEVFVRGEYGNLWHIRQTSSSPTGWSAWAEIGGEIGDWEKFEARGRTDGGLEVFTTRGDGKVWHIVRSDAGAWGQWSSLPGGSQFGQIAVGTNQDGRLEVFAREDRGVSKFWHIWQQKPLSASWSDWASLGDEIRNFDVNRDQNGALEVFATSSQSYGIERIWQTSSLTGWSDWEDLGTVGAAFQFPASGAGADGRLKLFSLDTEDKLWMRPVPPSV